MSSEDESKVLDFDQMIEADYVPDKYHQDEVARAAAPYAIGARKESSMEKSIDRQWAAVKSFCAGKDYSGVHLVCYSWFKKVQVVAGGKQYDMPSEVYPFKESGQVVTDSTKAHLEAWAKVERARHNNEEVPASIEFCHQNGTVFGVEAGKVDWSASGWVIQLPPWTLDAKKPAYLIKENDWMKRRQAQNVGKNRSAKGYTPPDTVVVIGIHLTYLQLNTKWFPTMNTYLINRIEEFGYRLGKQKVMISKEEAAKSQSGQTVRLLDILDENEDVTAAYILERNKDARAVVHICNLIGSIYGLGGIVFRNLLYSWLVFMKYATKIDNGSLVPMSTCMSFPNRCMAYEPRGITWGHCPSSCQVETNVGRIHTNNKSTWFRNCTMDKTFWVDVVKGIRQALVNSDYRKVYDVIKDDPDLVNFVHRMINRPIIGLLDTTQDDWTTVIAINHFVLPVTDEGEKIAAVAKLPVWTNKSYSAPYCISCRLHGEVYFAIQNRDPWTKDLAQAELDDEIKGKFDVMSNATRANYIAAWGTAGINGAAASLIAPKHTELRYENLAKEFKAGNITYPSDRYDDDEIINIYFAVCGGYSLYSTPNTRSATLNKIFKELIKPLMKESLCAAWQFFLEKYGEVFTLPYAPIAAVILTYDDKDADTYFRYCNDVATQIYGAKPELWTVTSWIIGSGADETEMFALAAIGSACIEDSPVTVWLDINQQASKNLVDAWMANPNRVDLPIRNNLIAIHDKDSAEKKEAAQDKIRRDNPGRNHEIMEEKKAIDDLFK